MRNTEREEGRRQMKQVEDKLPHDHNDRGKVNREQLLAVPRIWDIQKESYFLINCVSKLKVHEVHAAQQTMGGKSMTNSIFKDEISNSWAPITERQNDKQACSDIPAAFFTYSCLSFCCWPTVSTDFDMMSIPLPFQEYKLQPTADNGPS